MNKNILPLLVVCFVGYLLYLNNTSSTDEDEPVQYAQAQQTEVSGAKNIPQSRESARRSRSYVPPVRYKSSALEEDIIKAIICVEGFTSVPKWTGAWSVGYGSSYYADGTPVTRYGHSVSRQEARDCLIAHLRKHVYPVIRQNVRRKLSDNEYISCCMFIYNVGDGAFLSSSFLKALNNKSSPIICAQKMALYNKVNGSVWSALQKRRWLEGAILCGYISPSHIRSMRPNHIYGSRLAALYDDGRLDYSPGTIRYFLRRCS